MARNTVHSDLFQRNPRQAIRRKRKLNQLTFFVTSHCNATCQTCFYWDELNSKGDLSWAEIVRLSENSPQFTDLLFSGGEPTLRRELPEIIDLFVKNNGVRHIKLPTNGLKPQRTFEIADQVLTTNKSLELDVNIALDGLRESHDTMRGVPGNFDRAIETAHTLRKLKPKFGSRFEVHFNTVITRDNLDEIMPLAEFIRAEVKVDDHYFNLVRGDPKDPALKDFPQDKLRKLYPQIARLHWKYAGDMFAVCNPVSRWFMQAVYVGIHTFHNRVQLQNHGASTTWPMQCTAGETSAVIDFDGRVRACEMRAPLGNLRDHDMNLKVFWETPTRKQEVDQITCDKCWCSHVCFIYDSLRYSKRAMFWEIPKNFVMRDRW